MAVNAHADVGLDKDLELHNLIVLARSARSRNELFSFLDRARDTGTYRRRVIIDRWLRRWRKL